MNDWNRVRQQFNRAFEHWAIELPTKAIPFGKVWHVAQEGWVIWARFDINAKDGRKHLDYYAMHRMTDDRHLRLYADGEVESLPTISMWRPAGATEEEDKVLRDEFFARNREVAKMLEQKGFLTRGETGTLVGD